MTDTKKQRIVVVGNGMVGYKCCANLVDRLNDMGQRDSYDILTFCEEPRVAYDRVKLSSWFDGKSVEDLTMAPQAWYEENGITLFVGEKANAIDRERQIVKTDRGTQVGYDKLILATGSFPFVPPIPGVDKEGVFVYRTIEDLEEMTAYSKKSKTAAVIGGGLLGLEAAKAMVDLGLKTHVIEFAPRLMPRQIDDIGSRLLEQEIEKLGVTIHLNKGTNSIEGSDTVESMIFNDESTLDVDMVVVSAGIRPRDELAKEADLAVGPRGGIHVDNNMLTSDENIYAVGECALHGNMIYGLIAPGYRMAEACVDHILGGEKTFEGCDMSTKLKLMGVDVSSIGDPFKEGDDIESVIVHSETGNTYKKLVIEKESKKLLGAILVGDNEAYTKLYQAYLGGTAMPDMPETLLVAGGEEEAGLDAMPDEAQICSCENVTKGQLCSAIADGNTTVGCLKTCTKAGTGCGSCVPLMTDLLNSELEKSGVAVDKSLCAHFPYTRQELVQIVKASKITTYDELLAKHGKGNGCEICKPAVASILASYVNEYILNPKDLVLQDTNDRALANMQRNGTYSVVPRVPGGELFPEQLIAMGQVAKKYNLYTKITGGQRVDLFGARLEDLPKIWAELIDAGLESGHAYAKSLRTVKSCVGSTWCRFGVQDSTTMAIDVENRYKGIRTPHKVKMAVSGCARECAEAQSKDVGIIATENGWNLYLCGNGGMKPAHAVLFATDIDTETCIKYIDRFMMYYIRTADRLQRTATWYAKLPGGLKHLQDVIINDSLGICAELEDEMTHLVNTFKCEWKATLEDPERLKHFRTFVNTPDPDNTVSFAEQRGQIRPLTDEEAATKKKELVGAN